MKDLLGREINEGDVVVATDYNQCALYMAVVTKVTTSTINIQVSATHYGSWSKRSSDHVVIVGNDVVQSAMADDSNRSNNFRNAMEEYQDSLKSS